MGETLADLLRLVQPSLAHTLVDSSAFQAIEQLARSLPAIPLAGFECRLGDTQGTLALQQGIQARDDEPAQLAAHITQAIKLGWLPEHLAWKRILSFCESWQDAAVNSVLPELWLEHDLDSPHPLVPSVFVGLPQTYTPSNQLWPTALHMLQHFLGDTLTPDVEHTIRGCFAACPEGAHISHIGFMLSRPLAVVRLNVRMLRPETVASYLRQIDWPGPEAEIKALSDHLFDFVDKVRLCIDVGQRVYPHLGMECYFDQQSGLDVRWEPFLDRLIAQGLCTQEQRDAVVAWPGSTTPMVAVNEWPDSLLIDALRHPVDQLSLIDRRISHAKLTYRPELPLEAKIYLGLVHVWHQYNQPHETAMVAPKTNFKVSHDRLQTAIASATTFLVNASNQGGWWLDYDDFDAGASDEWVTAYVGSILAGIPSEPAQTSARRAWDRLLGRQIRTPGWGYNRAAPPDADSTGWFLALAHALNENTSPSVQAARQFIHQHVGADGGIATYNAPTFAHYAGIASVELGGWGRSHPCVSAALAVQPEFQTSLLPYLRSLQQDDGSWQAYWWDDDEYTTSFATLAMIQHGNSDDESSIERARDWATHRIGPSGSVYSAAHGADSVFATALLVRMLAASAESSIGASLQRAVKWLLEQQHPDGSWNASARMLRPPRSALSPSDRNAQTAVFLDQRRNFTSATVLMALHSVSTLCQDAVISEVERV